MKVILFVAHRISLVALICSSCIIFTLAMAELSNLEGRVLQTNSSVNVVRNESLSEDLVSPPPVVPPMVDVIHGKVNSVVHEIHGSFEDIRILIDTAEVKRDDSLASATVDLSSPVLKNVGTPVEQTLVKEVVNFTTPEAPPPEAQVNMTAPATPDDIPSFSEWAKKHMAEAGRSKGENLTVGSGGAKLRNKNYASPDCGAKVIAANPEAGNPSAILSATRDDYMLNPCNVKIWFIVELCEPIQPQRIEIANFELFSSSPQELSVYISDRFPSRDWSQTSALTAKDERTVQSFQLPRVSHFVKYVKVELHSHYGSEHFCPISLFRAYGTSELEVLENVDSEDSEPDDLNDEDQLGEKRDLLEEFVINATEPKNNENGEEKTNLFGSAKAAVMSIVKKAAEVLVKGPGNHSAVCSQSGSLVPRQCFTPSYQIVCNNCSEDFYDKIYQILCCRGTELQCLLSNPYINSVVSDTQLCNEVGLDWSDLNISYSSSSYASSPKVAYLKALLPRETIAALCNYVAINRKKVLLNISNEESFIKNKSDIENNVSSTPLEDFKLEQETINIIQPTKVIMTEEPTTIDEVISETASTHNKSKDTIPQAEITPSEIQATDLPVTHNDTVERVININDSQPVIEPTTDEPTVDSLALDSLFPESEEEHEETKTATAVPVQKESVFVRLANRIKALEVNMSLSSQYLEELSRRYKKQVEELQRTLGNVVEERRLATERESLQAAQLASLALKVETLTTALGELIAERDSWLSKASVLGQHGLIVILEVFGFIAVVWVWRRLGGSGQPPEAPQPPPATRRHSAEEPRKKNTARRPSEEACLPSGGTHQDLLTEGPKRKISREGVRKRKRRRKGGEIVVVGSGGEWQPLKPGPDYMKTAAWSRGKRSSQTQTSSSQEALSICSDTAKPKKVGAFRRFVKKLF